MIDVLVYRLMFDTTLHETVVKHRSRLKWAAAHGEGMMWTVLDSILLYDEKHNGLPTRKGLLEFCASSDDPLLAHRAELIEKPVREIRESAPPEVLAQYTDVDVLVNDCVATARKEFYTTILNSARQKVNQAPQAGKKDQLCGPDGAMAFLRKMLATDLSDVTAEMAGIWQSDEAIELLKQRLADYLSQKQSGLIRTGFERIDKTFLVNRGRILVLMGSSGDGKSTLLHSMVYNIAQDGHNVLYVTLEFKPSEIWEFLAFIHTHQYRDRLFLPSQNIWASGGATEEDRKNMETVLDDIRQRTTVPGLIDVQQFFTWEDLEAYFEANDPQNHYAAVVVDYLYKMNPPENKYVQENVAKNTMVSRAITWVHKRDTVLISPHQVNREGHKGARKDKSTGYALDDLYMSSALQQDADLVMSVLSSKENKVHGTMEVGSCKARKPADDFANHELHVDLRTGYVQDSDVWKAQLKAKAERDLADLHGRMEERRKKDCEDKDKEFVPQELHGSTETLLTIPDTENL
jgi:RecA/RadA recombinase